MCWSKGGERQLKDEAERDIDRLAEKHIGQNVNPCRQPGEQRISYLIEPSHVWHPVAG